MIKRLTAALTALVLVLHTVPVFATGEYYEHRDLPKITADDLVYKSVDITELEGYIAEIKELVNKKGNEKKIMSLIDDCFGFYRAGRNSHILASLACDRDFSTENAQNLNNAAETSVQIAKLMSEMIYCLYESDYKYLLGAIFDTPEEALEFALPKNDEISELLNKENELQNRYSKIYGDSDACAELFIELIGVRNRIAQLSGYDNYAEYANERIYGRGYTKEQKEAFCSNVKEFIWPLYEDSFVAAFETSSFFLVPMSEDEVLLNARAAIKGINPELAETFEYLIANNIYDIRFSDKKNPSSGAYTIMLPEKEVPFIFINPTEDYEYDACFTVKSLIHEFGHFSAILNTPAIDERYGSLLWGISVDTAEIHSQGLEVLAEQHYGKMFGRKAPEMRYCMVLELLSSMIDGYVFNKWQEEIYAMENPTVDDLNNTFIAITNEIFNAEYEPEVAQEIWTTVPHNYTSPMYYFSYALSAMAVLGLYSESITDYDGAVDKYMRISAAGAYAMFDEVTEECGLYDIFDAEFVSEAVDNIKDVYGFGYSDITGDEWYTPFLFAVSNVMDGRTEDEFMPDEPITRSEFVGTLGRMYDYYIGIDGEYVTVFSDVGSDENAEYIAWAAGNGIVDGYDDEIFGVNDPLTREQAAAIIFRLADEIAENTDISVFADADEISEWAKPAVEWAVENKIVDGRDSGEFDPRASITRAETAKIVSCYIYSEY